MFMKKANGEKHIASTVVIAVLCVAVIAAVIAIAVLSANKREPDPITEQKTSTAIEESATENSSSPVIEITEIKEQKFRNEEALRIFIKNKDKWFDSQEDSMYGIFYGFIDFDEDGVPELVKSICDGSARFSYNYYYSVDIESETVNEIASDEEDDGFDWCNFEINNFRLLRNKSTDELVWFACDYVRDSYFSFGYFYGTLKYYNGSLHSDILFSESTLTSEAPDNDTGNDMVGYGYYPDGDFTEVGESEYNKLNKEFFDGYDDLNCTVVFISSRELSEADSEEFERLMTKSFRAFNYDGYSF